MLYPIPYQSPAPVVFGPFSPDNMGEYANLQSWTWTTGTSTLNNNLLYGVPFTLQSSVLAQAVWYSGANASGGVGANYDYIFGIYNDLGALQAQTAVYGMVNSVTPRPAGTAPANGLAPLTSPVTLAPGNYYLCFLVYLQLGSGATGMYAASNVTPIQTNVALGVKEADVSWTPLTSTALPSTVTWRTPTVTQCALVQMQGIGVTI